MNTKTKCCENCLNTKTCGVKTYPPCIHWTRNPRLWLDIEPDEPIGRAIDFYFWRHDPKDQAWLIIMVAKTREGIKARDNNFHWTLVSKLGGQWQGPIKPEG